MRRSALFIDFDNFFGGLLSADPAAAMSAAEDPSRWLERLVEPEGAEVRRKWLMLRCYLNPGGSVPDPKDPSRKIYFSRFRPAFTQAGFEVVDCPSLTAGAKNGADIRIVVDAMTALQARTTFEEIVIASSDADFTPLLQVVRANDRRITVIATGPTAAAYEALADEILKEDGITALMGATSPTPEISETETSPERRHSADESGPGPDQDARTRFSELVGVAYADAAGPITLSTLANRVREELGDSVANWFGTGGFVAAIRLLDLPGATVSQHYLWDASRHEAPTRPSGPVATPLPGQIARVAAVSSLPRIRSEGWPTVYRSLETYANLHEFNLTQASRWARDYASGQGVDLPRQAFSYVVRACHLAGAPLHRDPVPTTDEIAGSLLTSVLQSCETAGLDLDEDNRTALASWLHVDESATT